MTLFQFIHRQNFRPGLIGALINPFYFARKRLYQAICREATTISGKVLDVGCGKKPYQHVFANVSQYIGMDIENPAHDHSKEEIDVYYDGINFPFVNDTFDSVVCNQVLEHVFQSNRFLDEVGRVLRPGGNLLLTVPFMWPEHEQPFDNCRYTSFGIRTLIETRFDIVSFSKCTLGTEALFQLAISHFYLWMKPKNKFVDALIRLMLSPLTILGIVISFVIPGDDSLYLDNLIVAKRRLAS
jgi:SAM-dependent methyltransferase